MNKVHEEAFEEIKARLWNPTVLHLLDNKGRFKLFSDTSKTSEGSHYTKFKIVFPN